MDSDGFVPDEELATEPKPEPSLASSIVRGAGQGITFGFGDELKGARAAVGGLPEPVRVGVERLPVVGPLFVRTKGAAEAAGGGSLVDRYLAARDAERKANAEARSAHKAGYIGGEVVGGVAIPVGAGARAATMGGRIAQGAKIGAATGGLYGAGASGGGPGQTIGETAGGALMGGAVGGAVPLLGPVAAWISKKLHSSAIEQGRKALSGIGTALSARKQVPEQVVEQALETGAIKPLGTVKGTALRLEGQAEELGQEYAAILKELEARGVTGPNAVLLAQRLAEEAKAAAKTSLGSVRPGMLQAAAEELPTKVSPVPFAPKRLGLMQAEEIKRGLQAEAKREYDRISRQTTTAGETKKEIAALMRQAIEDSVAEQSSKAPAEAAAFLPVKARLANTLGALRVAEEGAARAARRKPLSLTSTIVGSAAGGATGSLPVGALTALGHGIVDSRLASTLARAAYGGSKLSSVASAASSTPVTERMAALLAELEGARAPLRLHLSTAEGEGDGFEEEP